MKKFLSYLAIALSLLFSSQDLSALTQIYPEWTEGEDLIWQGRGWYVGAFDNEGINSYLWPKIPASANHVKAKTEILLPDGSIKTAETDKDVSGEWWSDDDKKFPINPFQQGNYTLTATYVYNLADGSTTERRIVGKFNYNGADWATGHIGGDEKQDPSATITFELIPNYQGCDFKYQIHPANITTDDIQKVEVALMTGGQPFNESAFGYSNELSGTIKTLFEGQGETVWLKSHVILNDGTIINCDHFDEVVQLNKKQEIFDVTLNITKTGDFVRTSTTSGTLPYQITPSGEGIDLIDHYIVFASRAGNEDMGRHETTNVTGVLQLDDLLPSATTGVWIKVQGVSANGTTTPVAQAGPFDCNTAYNRQNEKCKIAKRKVHFLRFSDFDCPVI